jgi:uroporphyrinogen III methyltransferase/synthase
MIPIVYPTITVTAPPSWQPLDDAIDRLDDYAWAIFTSPSAVGFTLGRLGARAMGAEALSGIRLAAVGSETARALVAAGCTVALVPAQRGDQQRQEGLLELLLAALPPPTSGGGADPPAAAARILFPQALGGRELLRDELARRGYAVDVVPVSQTRARDLAASPPPPFDVATFASPSALRAFVERLGGARLAQARVAVIGPTTAQAAQALGVRVDAMPSTPSVAALVQCLADLRDRTS